MAPRVSHTQYMFRKFFPIYAFCEVIYLSVVNYSVRFLWKTHKCGGNLYLILSMAVSVITTGNERDLQIST